MKTFKHTVILTALVLGGIYTLLAQSPGVPYQAYIVDANKVYVPGEQLENVPLANTDIMLQFEIKDSKGAVEYVEQIPLTTDKYGMVHTIVGVDEDRIPILGKFEDIKWDGKPKTMGIDIDFTGKGNQFQPHGTTPLVYIPGPGNGGFPESVTTFVDNGDNTFTYTSEDGTKTHMRMPTIHGNGDPNGNGTTGQAGDIYVDDSTGDVYTYNNTTNTWMPHGGNSVTTAAAAPSGASEGDIWFDTTSGGTFVYDADGAQWLALDDQAATEVAVTDGTVDIDGDGTPDNNVTVQDALENLDKIVQATETTSTLTNNNDGTYTYTDEDGTTTTFDVPQSGSGNPNTNGTTGQVGDIYIDESTGDVYTYDGSTWVPQSGGGDVTSAAAAPSGASEGDIWFDTTSGGTFVYDADGAQWLALDDQAATEVAVTDGTVDIDGDGTPDNNVTVQEALENLDKIVQATETTSTLTNNNDGTYTYTDEDGTKTTFDVPQSGSGNPNTNGTTGQVGDIYIDESTGDVYTYDGSTWVPQSGGGDVTSAAAAPSSPSEGDIWFDTTSGGTFVYDADGAQWLALDDQAATEVAVTDGTVDIDGDGTPDNNVTVQEALENLDKIVQATETTSTLTNNNDGTYTYTDEDGTKTTFDVPQSGSGNPNTNNVPGTSGDIYIDESTGDVYTYDGSTWVPQSGGGDVTSAAAAPSSPSEGDIWFDTTSGGTFVYDADGTQWLALDDQAATEVAVTDGTVDIDGDGTPDNNVTVQEALENLDKIVKATETTSTLTNNNDGTYTYTDEDGTTTNFDVTRSGSGAPNGVTGTNGDVYVDESTGDLYTYSGGNWVNVSSAGTQTLSVGAKNTDVVPIQLSNSGGTVNIEEGSGILLTENTTTNTVSISVAGGVGAADEPWRTGTNAPATNTSGDIYYDNGDVSIGTTTNRRAIRTTGAVYRNVRTHTSSTTPIPWNDDDFIFVVTTQPDPFLLPEVTAAQTGRVIFVVNQRTTAVTFDDGNNRPDGDHPKNLASIWPGVGQMFVCDGTNWFGASGR